MTTASESSFASGIGLDMHKFAASLFPICRSITGNGVRETLQIIGREIPLQIYEVPSREQVFDWQVPLEWNITEAYIKNSRGERIIDFANNNLHVLNYSTPVHKTVTLEELRKHLFYLEEYPEWIPYRTSYYREDWGFCLTYKQYLALTEPEYEVCISSTLTEGSLTYAECYIPGSSEEEILISAHVCHPSLANDNLSGIAVASWLAKTLLTKKSRYSFRFIFIPGTIGAITWLAKNESSVHRIKFGMVASLLGDSGKFTYKRSRRGDTLIDRIAEYVLVSRDRENRIIDFYPYGYDERQFCSPGFNLAVGCLSRTPYGQYKEYHTSADNMELIKPASLAEAYEVYHEILSILDSNDTYVNLQPRCEPQLGKRGLYSLRGGNNDAKAFQMALLWVLNLSDGEHSLFDIAIRSNTHFKTILEAAAELEKSGLLSKRTE